MKFCRLISGILTIWILSLSYVACAAPGKPGITLDPYIQELTIKASDENANFDLKITNNTGKDGDFKLVAVDFGTLNDSGGILFAGTDESQLVKKYGLANWLSLPSDPVTIKQGETMTVPMSTINSTTLSPGGHYAAILITPDFGGSDSNRTSPRINVKQTISCLVLAVMQGGASYDLRLTGLSDNHNFLRTPTKVNVSFHNPGNVHVVPRGIVMLKQGNKEVARGIVNEESGFVLPEADRKFNLNLKTETHSKEGLFFTTYELRVDYRYDGYDYFASSNHKIRVLNVKFVSLALIFLIVLAIRTYPLLKRHKHYLISIASKTRRKHTPKN